MGRLTEWKSENWRALTKELTELWTHIARGNQHGEGGVQDPQAGEEHHEHQDNVQVSRSKTEEWLWPWEGDNDYFISGATVTSMNDTDYPDYHD